MLKHITNHGVMSAKQVSWVNNSNDMDKIDQKLLLNWRKYFLLCLIFYLLFFSIGFEDSLRSLEKLTNLHFELPVDLAVRQFQNIKDAF